MPRLRVKLAKSGPIRFISHLEWGRGVERASRRARLPLALTQGFSPRPKISLGPALGVGISSQAEYADIYLTERCPLKQVISKLDDSLPSGIEVKGAEYVPDFLPSLTATAVAARYEVEIELSKRTNTEHLNDLLADFMKRKKLIVQKRNREREIDLGVAVKSAWVKEAEGKRAIFELILTLGESSSIRPEAFTQALFGKSGIMSRIISICRLDLYTKEKLSKLEGQKSSSS